MHYVLDYIHEFVTLAEIGNFSEAAENLYISQSSLSKHIMKMEQELGEQLFDRTTREVSLSDFGKSFLPYARTLDTAKQSAVSFVHSFHSIENTRIDICAIPMIDVYGLPQLIQKFRLSNPDYAVNVIESYDKSPLDSLRDGSCDLAFLRTGKEEPAGFRRIHYADDAVVAVFSVNHRFARLSGIPLSYLRNDDFFLVRENTSIYNLCLKACRNAGFEPNVVYTSHRIESLGAMVERQMGVALLTRRQAERIWQPTLSIVDLEPEIQTHVSFYYPSHGVLSGAVSSFVSFLGK